MAEGIALLAHYGDDADDMEEEEDQTETAAPEATGRSQPEVAEKVKGIGADGGEIPGEEDGAAARAGSANAAQSGPGDLGGKTRVEQNGASKGASDQAPGWKSPLEERRSPKVVKTPAASPVGSRAGSRSPLDAGRLGRSPLGQRMGLAGVEVTEENEQAQRSEPAEASGRGQEDEDDLSDFLPPPPEGKCSEELQRKFAKWVELLKQGQSYNDAMRRSKPYRNPDFLGKVVAYQEIDEIGSCFPKDIFDPHGLPVEDFYDNLGKQK
jgi:hypothetical protein